MVSVLRASQCTLGSGTATIENKSETCARKAARYSTEEERKSVKKKLLREAKEDRTRNAFS